jgi:hypothetical protein
MARLSRAQIQDEILYVIGAQHNGVTQGEIRAALKEPVHPRTLQRHILNLKEQALVFSQGYGRATRYFLRPASLEKIKAATSGYIPTSAAGEAVRQAIAKPLSERESVNYKRAFLFDYIPNETYYLKLEVRQYLHEIGKQPDAEIPGETFANKILNRLLIDLSWNSSRLEGNTYSLLETERLIDFSHAASGKDLLETRMILNHKAAIEFLVELGQDLTFNSYIILNLHALLANNLLSDPNAAGRLRTIPVGIGRTTYKPITIPQLIEEYFRKILEICSAIKDPFEQSFFGLVHFPYLQPFIDVNKRVSRLACNIPLIKDNYCPITFVDVPTKAYIDGILGVYELNNVDLLLDVYLWSYERSTLRYSEARSHLGEPDVFIERNDVLIKRVVQNIVFSKATKDVAVKVISKFAEEHMLEKDQKKFIEVVDTELLALHEGNIAKFKIKPHDFHAWQDVWIEQKDK